MQNVLTSFLLTINHPLVNVCHHLRYLLPKRHFIQHRSIHTRVHFDCVGVVQHKYQRVIHGDASATQCFNLQHSLCNYSLAADFPGDLYCDLCSNAPFLHSMGNHLTCCCLQGNMLCILWHMLHINYYLRIYVNLIMCTPWETHLNILP